jgi:peptide-methionine (R)-S-oxide reductase
MPRRQWLKRMSSLGAVPVSVAMATINSQGRSTQADQKVSKLEKPKAEWRKLLTPEAYAVLFEERTEAPFTSPLDREKRQGTYVCTACYLLLFSSNAKFDSGTGWPTFSRPLEGRVPRSATTGSSSQEPNTAAYAAVGTRVTCSTTGRHPLDSAGATTAWR